MLTRREFDNGVVCLISPLLESAGIPHGFSTRIGGVSTGPFASLNLGNPQGDVRDSDSNIRENYLRLFAALQLNGRELARVHQVHGNRVLTLRHGEAAPKGEQADGLLTDNADLVLSIRTADCVPVLIGDRSGRTVAAVHAGWRGVVAGIVPEAIRLFAARGIAPGQIVMAIGPCISTQAFEVGEEVAEQFVRSFADTTSIIRRGVAKPHIDLPAAIMAQALRLGLREDQIDTTDLCTFRDAELFFSHRRDSGITGRMAAVIAPRA